MGAIWLNGSTYGYPNVVDVLRGAGVNVVEYSGWHNRSRSSGGFTGLYGILCHHTASNTTPSNDLNYMVYGSPDAPVSNGLLDRTGTFTVIAGGASNHGGKGGGSSGGGGTTWHTSRGAVPPDSSNSYTFGIEAANSGNGAEAWPKAQQDAYTKMVRALIDAYGMIPGSDIRSHAEWTPPRKIDPKGPSRFSPNNSVPWDMSIFRNEVAGQLPGPVPDEEELVLTIFSVDGAGAAFLGFTWHGLGQQVEWLDTQAKLDVYRAQHCFEQTIGLADCQNLYLIGRVPSGDHKHNWTAADFRGVIAVA